jgi:hypothetical protein
MSDIKPDQEEWKAPRPADGPGIGNFSYVPDRGDADHDRPPPSHPRAGEYIEPSPPVRRMD